MKEEILARNPNFEDEFRELVSLDGMRYFYHVTNQNGDEICNDGLYLVDKRLDSTTIEIPQEFIDDPINYCLQENGENYRKNPNIILLGIPEEDVKYAIVKNYDKPKNWNQDEPPLYVIPANYVIGYISNNFEIITNEQYEFLNEHYL